jgi:RimJ/RimL family protein N-acetyltransferase
MTLVELRDRDELASFFRRRPEVHAYELGDLDDFFWPHTRWFGWLVEGRLEQVALVYGEPDPPVLIALAEEPVEGMADLLRAIAPELPFAVYAHLSPGILDAPGSSHAPSHDPAPHLKLGLAEPDRLDAHDGADAEVLEPAQVDEIASFYADAYPGTWFEARMLETRRYVGIRREGRLVCVAGVHVWSPTYGVAALGNVATIPHARGEGLGTAACARLCRLLLDEGIGVISLNVRADNAAALRSYEKLGFAKVADYVEVMLERRG